MGGIVWIITNVTNTHVNKCNCIPFDFIILSSLLHQFGWFFHRFFLKCITNVRTYKWKKRNVRYVIGCPNTAKFSNKFWWMQCQIVQKSGWFINLSWHWKFKVCFCFGSSLCDWHCGKFPCNWSPSMVFWLFLNIFLYLECSKITFFPREALWTFFLAQSDNS